MPYEASYLFLLLFQKKIAFLLYDNIWKMHNGCQNSICNQSDKYRHCHDDDWLNDFIDGSYSSIDLIIVEFSDFDDDTINFSRFFTDLDHLDDHIREERIALERFSHGDTLRDVIPESENSLPVDLISDSSRYDTQGLHNGYSTSHKTRY